MFKKIYMPMFRGRCRTQIFIDATSNMEDVGLALKKKLNKGFVLEKIAPINDMGPGPHILPNAVKSGHCIFLREPLKIKHYPARIKGKILDMFPEMRAKAAPLGHVFKDYFPNQYNALMTYLEHKAAQSKENTNV